MSSPSSRHPLDWARKLGAILLVLSSLTLGLIGLGMATGGTYWGIALMAITPFGIWGATWLTPEGGTSGYCDKNI